MANINVLAQSCVDENFRDIYKMIAGKLSSVKYTQDGTPLAGISHTSGEITEIKSKMFNTVMANYNADFGGFETLAQCRQRATLDMKRATDAITKDGFYNPLNGYGTSIDPSMANMAYTPVLASPEESTAIYSSGGLAKIIIDKKSKGVLLNGYDFVSNAFTAQELKDLKSYADTLGFSSSVANVLRDGNVYGGSVLFPILAGDNPLTMAMTAPQLWKSGMLAKNCIKYFSEVDRWNVVVIPQYDICAQDYLNPRSFYVPISGIEVHTDRAAVVTPNPQPYWSAIRNLGWGMPDFTSYAHALMGYELMALSLPIMCQQMSLLVHELPLDGIIAQNGPTAAKQWQKENEEQLRNWSILNPKAINSFGEIKVVDRTYSGFDNLIDAIRKDVSAKAGIPESVIFFSQPSGIFNKTEEDVLLKQSETIRLIQRTVAPSLSKVLPYLAASLWGCPDWDTFVKYQTLQIDFDTPVISSPSQKAEIGFKYASTIKMLVDTGMTVESALAFAEKIIGEVELPSDFSLVLQKQPEVTLSPVEPEGTQGEGAPKFPRAQA